MLKDFPSQANLSKYVRVHIEEKPFGYTVCGKRFHRIANHENKLRLNSIVKH